MLRSWTWPLAAILLPGVLVVHRVRQKVFYEQRTLRPFVRVADFDDSEVTMKYLHRTGSHFDWPQRPDEECVSRMLLFYGPLKIDEHGPFTFQETAEVVKAYRFIKSTNQSLLDQIRAKKN